MQSTKVIYVHFNDTTRDRQDYFFGSVSAVYEMFSEEEIGIKYDNLLSALKPYGTYNNPYVRVIADRIIRKKSVRSNGKENEAE